MNFLERDKDELTLDGNGFEIEIKGKVIETLYLTVDQDALVQSEAAAGAYADVYDETVSYNFGEYPSVPMVTLEDIASEENVLKAGCRRLTTRCSDVQLWKRNCQQS